MKTRFIIIVGIVLSLMYFSRNFILDDGLIYARYISNALHGDGLVFNKGESVNALTSPLFAYLLLLTSFLLKGHVILAEQILFVLLFTGACFLAERLVPYAGIALSVMAFFYCCIGMESALFLFMLILACTCYVDSRVNLLPLILTLVLLTRFEGGLLIPVVALNLWRQKKIPSTLAYIPALALIVLYAFLNHLWYGVFLPSSTLSKLGQGVSGYWGRWPTAFLRPHVWVFGSNGVFNKTWYIIPITTALAYVGYKSLKSSRINEFVMPFCLSLTSFYFLFNLPAYHWYYAPLIFFAVIYAVHAIPKKGLSLIAMIAVLALEGVTNTFVMRDKGPEVNYVNMALWVKNNTPSDTTLASVEIGQIGWYSNRRLIDILGLTYPKNAAHIAHRDLKSWIIEDKPDYIIVHKPAWVWETGITADSGYSLAPVHFGNIYLLHRDARAH